MVRFFRVAGPVRLVALFLLLAAVRAGLYWLRLPLTTVELKWRLIGERVAAGALMYRDLWDDTGPLAALTYAALNFLPGDPSVVYFLLGSFLAAIQIFYFNAACRAELVHPERTHLAGLVYLVSSHVYFDFALLSPVLMANLFLLLALRRLFRQLRIGTVDEDILTTGLFIGMASLFYLPSAIFVLVPVVSLVLFASVQFRQYGLLGFGFMLPFLVMLLVYIGFDTASSFIRYFLLAPFQLPAQYLMPPGWLLVAIAPLLISLLLAFFRLGGTRFTNYESVSQQTMLAWAVAALAAFLISPQRAPHGLLPLAAPTAFFLTHVLIQMRRFLPTEVTFFVLVGAVVGTLLGGPLGYLPSAARVPDQNLVARPDPWPTYTDGRRVLVTGTNPAAYRNSRLATPYLNWHFARVYFENTDRYFALLELDQQLSADPPDVIVDDAEVVPDLFRRLPALAQQYEREAEGVYIRQGQR